MTKNYSGADIEALCREAALNALRRDIKAKEKIGPTITPGMEAWYKGFIKQVRQVKKPITLVA